VAVPEGPVMVSKLGYMALAHPFQVSKFPKMGCPTLPALFAGGWAFPALYNLHECTSNQSVIKSRLAAHPLPGPGFPFLA